MQRTGFVLCARINSQRTPGKSLYSIGGRTVIEHLCRRLAPTGLPIYVATPDDCAADFMFLEDRLDRVKVIGAGFPDDPLRRITRVADSEGLETIIRVTTDKIWVDPDQVLAGLDVYRDAKADYLNSLQFIPGTRFEICSIQALRRAAEQFRGVEHVTYAMRVAAERPVNWEIPVISGSNHRLWIDYPEDLRVVETILLTAGLDCTQKQALGFLDMYPWLSKMNEQPQLTIYTCAHNAEKWIQKAMGSVAKQKGFKGFEYLLVDDASSDRTLYEMAEFCSVYRNARWIRNDANQGLASSSNLALSQARGEYLVRLDADDYFVPANALQTLITAIDTSGKDVVYPDNFHGSKTQVQSGRDCHHVGGTIFRAKALHSLKFTDRLRGYEGLDLFLRARRQLTIGYLEKALFFYRQHPKSMSMTDLQERARLHDELTAQA